MKSISHRERMARFCLRAALCFCLVSLAAGCAKRALSPAIALGPNGRPIELEPAEFGPGPAEITYVSMEHKFVVIDFFSQPVPAVGTRLNVYREDTRVGTIQITEPVRVRYATADIWEGELRRGDQVR